MSEAENKGGGTGTADTALLAGGFLLEEVVFSSKIKIRIYTSQ